MSNLNNCCGDSPIYNVATPIPGPAGASAYIYVAFAETVIDGGNGPSSGNPSQATVGFQLDYPTATSDWFAVITSNVPLSPPVLADFDGYWVPLTGVTLSGINLEDDGVAVAGGPFNTVNFQGSGLTGVTVTDNGGNYATVEIVTAGLVKTHFTSFQALAAGNNLTPGASYWIVDIGDGEGNGTVGSIYQAECSPAYYANFANPVAFAAYPHNTGIIVRAISNNTVDPNGIYIARVPNPLTTQWFMPGTSYAASAPVASYNQVFTNVSGGPLVANAEPADALVSWDWVPRDNTTHYITEIQGCYIDIVNLANSGYPAIRERWDNKNNTLKVISSSTSNEFIRKVFRWGVSTINGNTINLADDTSKRSISDIQRSPTFINTGQLMNYGNVRNFKDNKVDTNFNPSSDFTLKVGTRFFHMYMNSQGQFYGNTLNNAVVSNITSNGVGASTSYRYYNNIISHSVLNNFASTSFFNNTITDHSVLGDIFYTNTAGAGIESLLDELDFTKLPNNAIIYNFGCKTWTAAGDASSDITLAGPSVLVELFGPNSTTGAAVGDYIQFIATSPANILNTVHVVATTPSLTSFTIADPTVPSQINQVITCRFYYPSIGTSITTFKNNTISRSVFRGINKTVSAATVSGMNTTFTNNILDYSFFENYVTHTPLNAAFPGFAYNAPGAEYQGAYIADNRFTNSIFSENKLHNPFYNNTISYTSFSANHDQTATGGIVNGGFIGTFAKNVFDGSGKDFPLTWNGSALKSVNNRNSILVRQNSFIGIFSDNYTAATNIISQCIIQTGGFIQYCNFKGTSVPGDIVYGPSICAGLTSVTVNASGTLQYMLFEGVNAGLDSLTWVPTTETKQLRFTDNLRSFTIRDQKISGVTKSSIYRQVLPGLTLSKANIIRNIAVVSSTPIPVTIGTTTYTRAIYTLDVTTQAPHLFTDALIGNLFTLGFRGFNTMRIVTDGDESTGIPYPNGIYKTISASEPYPYFIGFLCFATVMSIVDEYTFRVEVSQGGPLYQLNIGYLLHPSNSVNDSTGAPPPGAGIVTPYSDSNDPQGYVDSNWWPNSYRFNPYTTIQDSIIDPAVAGPIVRISINNSSATPPPTPTGGSRFLYQFKNWNLGAPSAADRFYDPATRILTIPHFFDTIGHTVLLGSWGAAATVQIDQIRDMPDNIPVRFITSPGTTVQFNLVSVTTPATTVPSIVRDSAATTYTITAYNNTPLGGYLEFDVYDELVLMRQGSFIRVISKIINQ